MSLHYADISKLHYTDITTLYNYVTFTTKKTIQYGITEMSPEPI